MNKNLDVSLVMEQSWRIFKEHWVGLCGILLVVMFVSAGVSYLSPYQVPNDLQGEALLTWYLENGLSYYAWLLLASGVQVALMAWFYKEALQRIKDKELVFNANVVLRYILANILVAVATYVSVLFCIIPVFFIAPRLIIAPLYILDNPNMSVSEAIERSWKATQGNVIALLVLGVIAVFIEIIGVFCCLIGVVPASVLCYLMLIVIYLYLTGQDGEDYEEVKQEGEFFVIEEKTVFRN